MRPTDMRTNAAPLVTAAVILAAGCASPAGPGNRPPDSTSTTASPAVSASSPDASRPPATRTPPTPSSDPDMPRDLIGPPVTLTGTVHVGTNCVALHVRGRRWALFGQATQALTDGQTATVHGRPIRLPSGCDADQALDVRTIR